MGSIQCTPSKINNDGYCLARHLVCSNMAPKVRQESRPAKTKTSVVLEKSRSPRGGAGSCAAWRACWARHRVEHEPHGHITGGAGPDQRGVGTCRSHRSASESRRHRPHKLPNTRRSFRRRSGPAGTHEPCCHDLGPNPIPVLMNSPGWVNGLHSHLQKLICSTEHP